MGMILCITPNVALDRTLVVPGYGDGGVFRPQQVMAVAGGKGVNVARAARILGGSPCCGGFLAGHIGALVASLAQQEGLDARWTYTDSGETRICSIWVDPAREITSAVNESGIATTPDDWARLRVDMLDAARNADAICVCGSLPPGAPLDAFASLLTDLRDMGKSVWVDTSGKALEVASGLQGVHLKVNDDEASAMLNIPIRDTAEAAQAVLLMARRCNASAVITLGKRGAVMSDSASVWHAQPPTIEAKSAVGSGDSFLAGLMVNLTQDTEPPEALRRASAAGAANALSVGGGQFSVLDFERVLAETLISL